MYIVKGKMSVHKGKVKMKLANNQHAIVFTERHLNEKEKADIFGTEPNAPDILTTIDIQCGSADGGGTEANTLVYALGDALFNEEVCKTIMRHAKNSQEQAMQAMGERPEVEEPAPKKETKIFTFPEKKIIVGGVS